MKEKMSARSARVVLGCCLLYAFCLGLGSNCKGIFFAPVAEAFGVRVSDVTKANLFYGITGTLFLPLCSKLFHRNYQKSLFAALTIFAGSMLAMLWCGSLPMYWALSALQGVTGCFLAYYPIQHLISRSAPSHAGTAMGIVLMSSGVVSIIMNPVCNEVITAHGWQAGYALCGLLILGTCLPAVALFLRPQYFSVPEKTDAAPDMQAEHVTVSKRKVLVFALLFTVPLGLFAALPQHCSNYAITLGLSASFGSILVSAGMAGNLTAKLLFGVLNDKMGAWKTTGLGLIGVIAGCLLLALSEAREVFMIGAFLSGITLALIALQVPLVSRAFFGNAAHDACYSTVCTMSALAGAASSYVLALIYDGSGSYLSVFFAAICTLLVCTAALALFWHHTKQMKSTKHVRRNCI